MLRQYQAAYRSVLRELSRSSIAPRNKRNREIVQSFRAIFESHRTASDAEAPKKLLRDARNIVILLRSQRIHKDLLDRYNPLHDMSQAERLRATARRVGLDMPIEGKDE